MLDSARFTSSGNCLPKADIRRFATGERAPQDKEKRAYPSRGLFTQQGAQGSFLLCQKIRLVRTDDIRLIRQFRTSAAQFGPKSQKAFVPLARGKKRRAQGVCGTAPQIRKTEFPGQTEDMRTRCRAGIKMQLVQVKSGILILTL